MAEQIWPTIEPGLNSDMLHNIHKVVFLANEYPTKTIQKIVELFQVPGITSNVAIWAAIDMGYLTIEEETGKVTIHKLPEEWEFGPAVDELRQALVYTLHHLARTEQDMEENYLLNWCGGLPNHDILVATRSLLENKVLSTYEVINETIIERGVKSKKPPKVINDTYTFWTLYDNREQLWGRKQFADQSRLK